MIYYLSRFIYVPCPHTAVAITDVLYDYLQSWDIDCRISAMTLDNCTTNDSLVDKMTTKIGVCNLLLEGKMLHMRCCAHILNLIVKDGMDVIGDQIVAIRDSVAYWLATPKRYEKFEKAAQHEKVELTKKLCLDCKTRWNSTYEMLIVAIPYRKVFDRLEKVHKKYTAPLGSDWDFAQAVCDRLQIFASLTELFSGTKYVTANLCFPKICEIKLKIRTWQQSEDELIREMSEAMIKKYDKYWLDIHGVLAAAVVLDPRYKMTMLRACYIALFGQGNCETYLNDAYKLLTDLMNSYQVILDQEGVGSSSGSGTASSSIKSVEVMSIFHSLNATKKFSSAARAKNELDRYLEEETLPHDDASEEFDILSWWKVAGTSYPTLRMVARDILAIPVTSVASESAFSTSGRVLSEHRSRLTPKLLEALMCSQDWLRSQLEGIISLYNCVICIIIMLVDCF